MNYANRKLGFTLGLRSEDELQLTRTREMSTWKSKLYVSEPEVESVCTKLKDHLKGSTLFLGCSVSFDHIDYYDNLTDVYYTPAAFFTKGKGKRKVTVSEESWGAIPKGWEEVETVRFKKTNTITFIKKVITYWGWTLQKEEEKEIRKVLQGKERNTYFGNLYE